MHNHIYFDLITTADLRNDRAINGKGGENATRVDSSFIGTTAYRTGSQSLRFY